MAQSKECLEALRWAKTVRQQTLEARSKAIERAVADVIESGLSMKAAAANRNVPVSAVSEEVKKRRGG